MRKQHIELLLHRLLVNIHWIQTSSLFKRNHHLCLVCFSLVCFFLSFLHCHSTNAQIPFDYQSVVDIAQKKAKEPFKESSKIPNFLQNINYDKWRDIRFRPQKALWKTEGLPFHVQFFHTGFLYDRKVLINTIDNNEVKRIEFSPDLFHYGNNSFQEKIPKDLGFAGFRLHHPINSEYYDEVAVFLGASYFRAVGKGKHFGLSSRGLALNTAVNSGEEFPCFREFWLKRPEPGSNKMTILALLDSPSATGGYEFVITVEEITLIEVKATVFLRNNVQKVGIAPLTSMFFYGENTHSRGQHDFRPEVHDSDGLLIQSNTGEWIWRPLLNPDELLVTSFELNNPKGFGLLQRDKDFDHYQDLETHYENRPNLWIVPQGNWGKGRVELVQIPTGDEKFDNIVAYWIPDDLSRAQKGITCNYLMKWGASNITPEPIGRVVATRTSLKPQNGVRYLIDFQSEKLDSFSQISELKADISIGRGKLKEHHLQKNTAAGGWRLSLLVQKENGIMEKMISNPRPLELRAFLRNNSHVLTETWSYVDPYTY